MKFPFRRSAKPEPWLRPLAPQILGGVIGVLGAVLGAWAAGYVQLRIEHEHTIEAEKQRLRDRAEEIVTLIEKTPVTYIAEKTAMLSEHNFLLSSDVERVTALVALYFPDASNAARAYENAGAEQSVMLAQMAVNLARHLPPPDDKESYQKALSTGDAVTEKVLRDVGITYVRRRPVVYPAQVP